MRKQILNVLLVVAVLILGACSSPKTNTSQVAEPKLDVTANLADFQKGATIPFIVTIESPVDTTVELSVVPSGFVELDNPKQTLEVKANTPQQVTLTGRAQRAGYHTLTVQAAAPNWHEPAGEMYGFNVVSPVSSSNLQALGVAANAQQPSTEPLPDHLNKLPVVSDFKIYMQQVKAELEGRDDVRLDFILKDATVQDTKGKSIKLDNMIVNYQPGTGWGKPEATKSQEVGTQASCSDQRTTTVHFDIIDLANGTNSVVNLQNNFVVVMDNNSDHFYSSPPERAGEPMAPTNIAQGYLDANGNFTFQQPLCDSINGNLSDPPDLYFQVESRKPLNPSSPSTSVITYYTVGGFTYTYWVYTGVWWNNAQSNINIRLNNNTSATTNAFWTQSLLWATGVSYLQQANLSSVPVKIFWPGQLVSSATDAYSPISRIILGTAGWMTTQPIIHEYGHNVKYYWDDRDKFDCAWNFLAGNLAYWCLDPNFGDSSIISGGYLHYPGASYGQPKAANEGWANAFYEVVRTKFSNLFVTYSGVYPQASTCNKVPTCYSYPNATSWTEAAYGPGNELRVSTFLYRFTKEILACNNINNMPGAYKRLTENLGNTQAGIYDLWNNYLYRAFPTDNNVSGCVGDADSNGQLNQDDYRYKLRSIFKETTLMRDDGLGYNGEWVRIP